VDFPAAGKASSLQEKTSSPLISQFSRIKFGSERIRRTSVYRYWLCSEFSRAMMSASTGSEGLSSTAVGGGGEAAASASLSSLATAIAERQQTGTTSTLG